MFTDFEKLDKTHRKIPVKFLRTPIFVKYLQTVASELVRYFVYIFLSQVYLQEKQEYENYLRITPECFDEFFVLFKDDITQ